jgi:hypothetical protein
MSISAIFKENGKNLLTEVPDLDKFSFVYQQTHKLTPKILRFKVLYLFGNV